MDVWEDHGLEDETWCRPRCGCSASPVSARASLNVLTADSYDFFFLPGFSASRVSKNGHGMAFGEIDGGARSFSVGSLSFLLLQAAWIWHWHQTPN